MADNKPEVAVIMGSASDWETMKHACEMLDQFEVPYMKQVISAHRTPELMGEFAHNARANGLKIIIAGAGVVRELGHELGRAVRGDDLLVVDDTELVENIAGTLHGLPVAGGSHDHRDFGLGFICHYHLLPSY